MELIKELQALGANTDEALERVMGDTSLYEMMLGMFVDSVRDNPIAEADFDGADLEGLIKRVHMLKGVTGNLSIVPLFTGYTEILGQLRGNQPQEAKAGYLRLQPVQAKIIDCIKQNQGA